MTERPGAETCTSEPVPRGRRGVVGVVIGERETWAVVARQQGGAALIGPEVAERDFGVRFRICRGINNHALIIGDADPELEHALSELLQGDGCGEA